MTATIPSTNLEAFRLSTQQKSVWLSEQGGTPRHAQCVIRIQGEFRPDTIKKALHHVVGRHEILRTRFPRVQGMKLPVQVISESLPVWREVDLSDLEPSAQSAAIEQLTRQALHRPLDLEAGALVQADLVRLNPSEHLLVITLPTLCVDVWSLWNIVRELSRCYNGTETDEESPVQYLQFSEWQHEVFESRDEDAELGRAHWLKLVRDLPPRSPLCFERESTEDAAATIDSVKIDLDTKLLAALQSWSSEQDVSISSVLTTCLSVVIGTFSAQTDLVFRFAVDGRKYEDLNDSIGIFASYVPVRLSYDPQESFRQVVRRTGNLLQQAVDLQEYYRREPLEGEPDIDTQTSFGLTYEDEALLPQVDDQRFQLVSAECALDYNKLHLRCLHGSGSSESLSLDFQYDPGRFTEEDIQRIAQCYCVLLRSALEQPHAPCADLQMLPHDQRQTLLVQWNDTQCDFPGVEAVHYLFEQAAENHPEQIALVFEDHQLTYRQLNIRANQLAHDLVDLGVGPDVLVGLCLERSLESIVGMLAILKAGGAYVPLDPTLPHERLATMLQDCGATLLVSTQKLAEFAPPAVTRVLVDAHAERIAQQNTDNPSTNVAQTDLVYVIYTSGSTGKPKGVAIEHRQLLNYIHGITQRLGLAPHSSYATVSTLAADLGHTALFPALCTGGCLHLVSAERAMDPSLWRDYFRKHRIDCLKIVPSHLSALLGSGEVEACCLPCSVLVLGGETSRWDLVERILASAPDLRVFNHYGPTETTVGVLTYAVGEVRGAEAVGSRTVPLGRPLANSRIYILNGCGQPVPVGVAGEVYIGGLGVGRGYLGSEELTAEKFVEAPFSGVESGRLYRTGDLARYLADGNVEFLGRVDHQVKIRGFRIELGEIESVLVQHPGVKEAVVLVREDVSGEKRLVGYVVCDESGVSTSELRLYLQEKLPGYMVPSSLVFLKRLPLTGNGKVDRKSLPSPETLEEKSAYVGARTALETVLLGIWEELLVREGVGVHEDFFELGGHSLLATQVISRVCETFQIEVPLRTLFEAPTVAGLAQAVEQGLREGQDLQRPPLRPVSRQRDLPLSFSQRRLWFIDKLEPGSSVYNVPRVLRLHGHLDAPTLQRALQMIVERHEVLRTNYLSRAGEPIQVISTDTTFPLPEVDLRALPANERELEAGRLCRQEAARSFDLQKDRLIRGQVLRLADDDQILLLTLHHIASDGWSNGVLMRELSALYNAFSAGLPSPLPPLPVQYADYAIWQREWLQGEPLQQQVDYWKSCLAGAPALLELPTDRPREEARTYQGGSLRFALSPELAAALQKLCREERSTPFMVLLAAFNVLLYRWTGQSDLIVGTDVANRTQPEMEGLIGFFLNHLVLRTDVSGGPSFREVVGRVRETAIGAYAHQDLPFDMLVEALRPERSVSHAPVFQVLFVLDSVAQKPPELRQLKWGAFARQPLSSKYDLALFIGERQEGLGGLWVYRADLFETSSIVRLSGQFTALLDQLLAQPDLHIEDVELRSEIEIQQEQEAQRALEVNLRGARRRATVIVPTDDQE